MHMHIMQYMIKDKISFLYIHATDILPAVILSLIGVYIFVGGKYDRFVLFDLLHKDLYLSGRKVLLSLFFYDAVCHFV